MRMVHEDSAPLLGAIQALSKTACALSMAPKRSARLTIAKHMLKQEVCVASMAALKCAKSRAARLVLKLVAVAEGMVGMCNSMIYLDTSAHTADLIA